MRIYTDKEKKELVKKFENRPEGYPSKEMFKRLGVSDCSIYTWRKQFAKNGKDKVTAKKSPTGLEFNIVQAKEARQWTTVRNFGRFAAFKESLISELRKMRKTHAITFSGPEGGEKKEVQCLHHAALRAVKLSGRPFEVRYSKSRNLFIVIPREVKK